MVKEEFLVAMKEHLKGCEYDFFTGPFSENNIKADIEIKKRTGGLSEKKQFYLKSFDETEKFIDNVLKQLPSNHEWFARYKRCKDQIVRLRELVKKS